MASGTLLTEQLRSGNTTDVGRLSRMEYSKDHGIVRDDRGEDQPKDQRCAQQVKTPAPGPHSKPELTDDLKTPGAGTLPDPGSNEDSTSG
jgi:hypothetical protein